MLLILAKKYEPHDLYFESLMRTDTITNMQINQNNSMTLIIVFMKFTKGYLPIKIYFVMTMVMVVL